MTSREQDLGRMGRAELLAEIIRNERELGAVYRNLTNVQERCTELLDETRAQRQKIAARDIMIAYLEANSGR